MLLCLPAEILASNPPLSHMQDRRLSRVLLKKVVVFLGRVVVVVVKRPLFHAHDRFLHFLQGDQARHFARYLVDVLNHHVFRYLVLHLVDVLNYDVIRYFLLDLVDVLSHDVVR